MGRLGSGRAARAQSGSRRAFDIEFPATVSDGEMETSDGPYHNLLMLPLYADGPVSLEVEFDSGAILRAIGESVKVDFWVRRPTSRTSNSDALAPLGVVGSWSLGIDMRMPVVFVPHGGGPWPFVEMGFPREDIERLARYLRSVRSVPPHRPRGLLVVSAHWETRADGHDVGLSTDALRLLRLPAGVV
jgi:hypothetical protein